MSQRLEYCQLCGDATGRAGRADDSIYAELLRDWHRPDGAIWPAGEEVGPLCVKCYCELTDQGLVEQ